MQDASQQARRQVQWYHPGEIVVVARVPRARTRSASVMNARVHNALRERARAYLAQDHVATRSITFDAPGESRSLVFSFHKLADTGRHRAVKDAVDELHQHLSALQSATLEVITAMPHFHLKAHEGHSGASPGSYPRPVYPDQVPAGWKHRFYQPVNAQLDLARAALDSSPVPVAVLDSRPDLAQAETAAGRLKNQQLSRTVQWLQQQGPVDQRYQQELHELDLHHEHPTPPAQAVAEFEPYRMPDHGLFVAGLVHGVAPSSPLTLEPVLDENGVGDLSLLLLGLKRTLERKAPRDPQIVNLSLGFLPHPARLPAAWYGLQRPHDPLYLHAEEMYDPGNEYFVAANREQVGRKIDLLEAGLRELSTYLSLNNCLVIAAAGNDSQAAVEARQARMEPRLPARFDTVLGVAATTSNPRQPARYSNVGDERELGDHVATFGGNASDALEPEDGVIGIYSGEFPDGRPNETGWAYWSGTSFATAIVSGIAANFWATRRKQEPDVHATHILAELHAEANRFGPYVPALRTPAIEVRGRWGH